MRNAPPVVAFVGLGSNLGDRKSHIMTALSLLCETDGVRVLQTSSLMENPAVGGPSDSPAFLNAVTKIETTLGSHDLLRRLMEIEQALGRTRRAKWEPRVIDLDIVLYGDQIISSDTLVVPHPLMHERRFVLTPLCEIDGEVVHPVLQMTARGLLNELSE